MESRNAEQEWVHLVLKKTMEEVSTGFGGDFPVSMNQGILRRIVTQTQSSQMKKKFKVINMFTIFTLFLFVFVICFFLLYCSVIIHLYKLCLFFVIC